jgi:DNA mismatch repair ATPase MutS
VKYFKEGSESAAKELQDLQKIISRLLIRENPIVRIIVNIIFPYDIFFAGKLIHVRSGIEENIGLWIEKLNEFECYLSLSNFAFINPDYVYPELSRSRNLFDASGIGHPLIKRESKVSNDFSLSKENEIVIITGSNMSGKSTFLRAAGMNLCLAYAGAPVNADKFTISLYELFTCIKVTDSVIDGISYFYAEVRRLKQLLDELEKDTGPQTFFLIDEIFKGTNNKERLAGSRAFIKRLSELEGTGFISTHDLELVNLESEVSSIENYHFKEEIVNGKMEFDFKIHKGPCPTTNALKIMEMSGLPVK